MEYGSDDEDQELLPSHYVPTDSSDSQPRPPKTKQLNHNNLSDVWDEREELFGIGDESDDEAEGAGANSATASVERGRVATPKITITAP